MSPSPSELESAVVLTEHPFFPRSSRSSFLFAELCSTGLGWTGLDSHLTIETYSLMQTAVAILAIASLGVM